MRIPPPRSCSTEREPLAARLRELEPEPDESTEGIDRQLRRFQLAFERGSGYHAGSDAFRARREFEIAYEALARAAWLATGKRGFLFAPRHLMFSVPERMRKRLASFDNPNDCARQHGTKEALVAILEALLDQLGRRDSDLVAFCRKVMARDRFWNHRDSAEHVDDRLRRGVLFRGASPHHHAGDPEYRAWLAERGIRMRVDLRAAFERERDPVRLDLPARLAPVDPWNESRREDPLHEGVDPTEGSYRFTAFRCTATLRATVDAILTRGPVLAHCFAGRDRTGVVVGLVQYLVGAPKAGIVRGFSLHADRERTDAFARVLALVEREGGPRALAERAGITADQVESLKSLMWRTP